MSVIERALDRLRRQQGAAGVDGRDLSPTLARLRRVPMPPPAEHNALDVSPASFIEFDLNEFGRAGLYSGRNSQIADEYRMIKRALIRSAAQDKDVAPDSRSNLLMVASALPGEGKTFTSVNLALSIAKEKDWQVLLIDADCKNPQLSRLLGVQESPGLIDALSDPAIPLESLILGTNIEGLAVLPLGRFDDHSAELFASSSMVGLCNKLSNPAHKRIVIFDSPPLLLTTESVILASHVGQIVVVVRANSTPQHAVSEALGKLDHDKAIGLVLNCADEKGEGGYGSYVTYGYPAA